MSRTLATFAAVFTTLFAAHVHAQTVVDDYTLNEVGGFDSSHFALDSVNSANYFGDVEGDFGTFGTSSIGGPSTNPIYFDGTLGFYAPEDRTAYPTNDFTVSLYVQVPTADLIQTGTIFDSNSNSAGGFQIGLEGGNFVAILDDGSGNNFSGTTIGSFTATAADTELSLTDINGVFTFTDNGVNSSPLVTTPNVNDPPLSGVLLGVPPGSATPYTGYMSDVTITADVTSLSVPEPSTYLMMGLGFLGLAAARRFRGLQVD